MQYSQIGQPNSTKIPKQRTETITDIKGCIPVTTPYCHLQHGLPTGNGSLRDKLLISTLQPRGRIRTDDLGRTIPLPTAQTQKAHLHKDLA
mmetsp:Transcript_5213/g.11131  ORF Transcript_5213/g.11131 Transcript_5213/m.11131 type:complete len:91 (-) Transcript_5213:731-1003(-)